MSELLLTIAIPTIETRKFVFNELFEELTKQATPYGQQIEIISLCDNKEMSIGKKRQLLNNRANGKYVIQWDDDDWICEGGIDMIMKGIETGCDVITYDSFCDVPEFGYWRHCHQLVSLSHSNRKEAYDETNNVFYVTPNQKNAIKREILNEIKFMDIRYKEDLLFTNNLLKFIKTEHHIDHFIYLYLNRTRESYDNLENRFNMKFKPDKLI